MVAFTWCTGGRRCTRAGCTRRGDTHNECRGLVLQRVVAGGGVLVLLLQGGQGHEAKWAKAVVHRDDHHVVALREVCAIVLAGGAGALDPAAAVDPGHHGEACGCAVQRLALRGVHCAWMGRGMSGANIRHGSVGWAGTGPYR